MNNKLTDERVSNATLIRLIQWAEQHNSHYVAAALCELQERRKADSAEPACYALTNMAGEVCNTHSSAQNAGAYRDLIHQSDDSLTLRVTPLYTVPPAPVVPDDWVMVPKEPTRQMMAQGHFAMKGTDRGKFRRIYQAMITAAPDLNKGGINAE
ncbi:hypothetical protein CJ367_03805 [Salmonella enterica]|nr:hypothetical protein [Salmonella enterica]EBP3311143.1 hypothetical protein [Salmonella enterica subsp. enterica]EBY2492977.1 hypothetical protein [Salmonella enterica subsp. enterica serovar Braenderup]EDT4758622.1 hypothetical protein [Salmonella enterica subsp. enterica serovar Thompson]EEN4011222.1 hypothetical protein [Salmonella enterica subsp. enterica serovar Bareilly]ELF1490692.1 hypothetical protein [Salmonella enterica subsp. enterica serovar Infantis]